MKLVAPYLFHLLSLKESPVPFGLHICGHLIYMSIHPPQSQHSFLLAPKISIFFANISCVSIYGSYEDTLQYILFFCNIAFMMLGARAVMVQTKVKRPLVHSSIGHVG